MERIKGCTHNTLLKITNEYMGSQWALFMATLVVARIHNGGPWKHYLGPIQLICGLIIDKIRYI